MYDSTTTVTVGLDVHARSVRLAAVRADEPLEERTLPYDEEAVARVLRRWPAGTLVDGELVAFGPDGRCDLALLLRRHGLTDPWKIGQAWRWCPLRYVLFDLLYYRDRSLMREPLARRRQALAAACAELQVPDVLFSARGAAEKGNNGPICLKWVYSWGAWRWLPRCWAQTR